MQRQLSRREEAVPHIVLQQSPGSKQQDTLDAPTDWLRTWVNVPQPGTDADEDHS